MVLIDDLLGVYKSCLEEWLGGNFIVPVKFSVRARDYLSSVISDLLEFKPSVIKSYVCRESGYELVSERVPDVVDELLDGDAFRGTFLVFNDLLSSNGYGVSDSSGLSACLLRLFYALSFDDFGVVTGRVNDCLNALSGVAGYYSYRSILMDLRDELFSGGFIISDFSSEGFDELFDYYIAGDGLPSDFEGFASKLVKVIGCGVLIKRADVHEVSFDSDYVFIHSK